MSKILNIDDMLDIAVADGSPLMQALVTMCEASATALAEAIGAKFDIWVGEATHEGGFGGLCATFQPNTPEQACPKEIDEGDPGGEWIHPDTEAELDAEMAELVKAEKLHRESVSTKPSWCGEVIAGASEDDDPNPIRCEEGGPRCADCQAD